MAGTSPAMTGKIVPLCSACGMTSAETGWKKQTDQPHSLFCWRAPTAFFHPLWPKCHSRGGGGRVGFAPGLAESRGSSRMKKFLIAGVAAATFCGASAFAADMPVKGSIAAPMFSWKGCYLGIEGGGEWGRSEHHFTDGVLGARINMDGAIIGGTSGCNWQNGNWVLGYESDLSWWGLKNTAPNLFVPAFTFGTKSAWLSTTRARLGIAADRSLWYITGGLASSDIKASDSTAGAFEQ